MVESQTLTKFPGRDQASTQESPSQMLFASIDSASAIVNLLLNMLMKLLSVDSQAKR
jgi:hypothetical protein